MKEKWNQWVKPIALAASALLGVAYLSGSCTRQNPIEDTSARFKAGDATWIVDGQGVRINTFSQCQPEYEMFPYVVGEELQHTQDVIGKSKEIYNWRSCRLPDKKDGH